jgi:hypothetical protein
MGVFFGDTDSIGFFESDEEKASPNLSKGGNKAQPTLFGNTDYNQTLRKW